MKKLHLFIFLVISFLGFSQNSEITPTYVFPKIKSSINVPIKIPLSAVSNTVNASVKNLIFEDNSYEDNDNDQFKVKVWKTKPIKILGGKNENLLIAVPLKIWAEKGIGTLGIYNYQSTTFETVMHFNTQISVNNNWTVNTKTTANGFDWVTKPVLDYGRIKIPITSLVEKNLKEQQAKFTTIIDEEMAKQLNFQEIVIAVWNLFSEPTEVSEEYKTWLKITPLNVNMTPLKFYGNQLETAIGIEVYSETFTGLKPAISPKIGAISNFNFVPKLEDNFTLNTTANIPYSEATRMAEEIFLNKEYDFREGKSQIKITGIKVYNIENRLMIEAETTGSVSGTSFISGIPVYNEAKKKIVLTDTKFKLKTKNIFKKTLTLLFQKKITEMIEEEYGIPTSDLELSSKSSIETAFNTKYNGGIESTGKVYKLKPQQILVTPNGITAIILTEAQLQLKFLGF